MSKRKDKLGEAMDRKIAYWAATDKEHKATVARLEKEHAHDLDWFDLEAYQKMIYEGGWSK